MKLLKNTATLAGLLALGLYAAPVALAGSPYAGIYTGTFSGAAEGVFCLFVGDDGAGVLIGYNTTYDAGGFYYAGGSSGFSVTQSGGFSFSASGAVFDGTISGSTVSGNISTSSGGKDTLNGTKNSSTGIEQANAGVYEGNIAGDATGPLVIVLAADGTTVFYGDPNGGPYPDAGSGAFNAAGEFALTSVGNVALNGSVSTATHVISGAWQGSKTGSGTFSATRTQTFTPITTPWPDAVDLGNGKKQSSWFGIFNDTYYPWIYHQQHGWMYVFGTDPASIWLWAPDMGFLWTGSGVYPWLWRDQDQTWLWYVKGSQSPRFFFNWNTQQWESENP
jgi:hypothetical protein